MKITSVISAILLVTVLLASCGKPSDNKGNAGNETTDVAEKVDSERTDIPTDLADGVNTVAVTYVEGTDACWHFDGNVLTFDGVTENTVCSVSGELDGQIVIDAGESKLELELSGLKLYSATANPIEVISGKATLTAKKETENFIYDLRDAVTDETAHSAAVYAAEDLNLGGKGTLTVISKNNSGIHSKDDLKIKNLTLSVTSVDNALKGNDGVVIESGVVTVIATAGDGIKTSSTEVSSKGKQKGTVSITGGIVTVYAACDGIDAAYNAEISESADVSIYTDRYSPYSASVEQAEGSGNARYIRFTSKSYSFSVKYYNSDSDYKWANATYSKSVSGGMSTYYYFSFEKLTGYDSVQIFIYSSDQKQGQEDDCLVSSDYMTWNDSYDTFALEQRGNSLTYNWTNYSSTVNDFGGRGDPGGMGGMADGNSEKGDYSTKGIKAGNEVVISGGSVTVKSYDDAIHANNESTLENGETPTGNVTVSGGVLTLFSKDDGIHADGNLTVSGGEINVTGSYEGLEGTTVVISGGNTSIVSSDDGINSTLTTGTGITFEDGKVYIYAGGDGIDANSRTSYGGILFAGGEIIVINTSGGNSSIDTEQGYTYTGGKVLAICPSNAMTSEVTKCKNFSSVATKTTMSLSSGKTVKVTVDGSETISLTMPCAMSAFVVYLGASGAKITG